MRGTSIPVGEIVGNDWDEYRVKIRNEFNASPAGFLRQPTISLAVHPNQQVLAECYLKEMQKNEFAQENILSRLHDIPLGDPFLCEKFPLASPMSVQHAWYMFIMQIYFGIFIPKSNIRNIVEFGGGYGNFCRLTYEFGYQGDYTILDFPEMHFIQKHFLGISDVSQNENRKINFINSNENILFKKSEKSIFIATFSLSESPLHIREKLENYYNKFSYILIAYNKSFSGVDNKKYFDELSKILSVDFNIKSIQDKYRSAWYILAKNKKLI